jgi:hypothetical protein
MPILAAPHSRTLNPSQENNQIFVPRPHRCRPMLLYSGKNCKNLNGWSYRSRDNACLFKKSSHNNPRHSKDKTFLWGKQIELSTLHKKKIYQISDYLLKESKSVATLTSSLLVKTKDIFYNNRFKRKWACHQKIKNHLLFIYCKYS